MLDYVANKNHCRRDSLGKSFGLQLHLLSAWHIHAFRPKILISFLQISSSGATYRRLILRVNDLIKEVKVSAVERVTV